MTNHQSPYHLAGPFAAAAALLAIAGARLAGRTPRPEYRASLVANLMTAGASAAGAYEVAGIGEAVAAVTPTSAPSERPVIADLEDALERGRDLLAGELTTDQLTAFELGGNIVLASLASKARWDPPDEQQAYVVKCLGKARQQAAVLQVELTELSAALATAERSPGALAPLGSELERVQSSVLNSLLHR